MSKTTSKGRVKDYIFEAHIPPTKPGGKVRKQKIPVPAKYGKKGFIIEVAYEDAEAAYNSYGQGEVSACAANFGICRQKEKVPVDFDPDWVDVFYSGLALGQVKKGQALPRRAVLYRLYSTLPRRFDDSLRGLKRLMVYLKEHGPIEMHFYPITPGKHHKTGKPVHTKGAGSKPGGEGNSKKKRKYNGRGSMLRRTSRMLYRNPEAIPAVA